MAIVNDFANWKPWNYLRPFKNAALQSAVKSDTVDLAHVSRGFMIAVHGTVKVTLLDGTTITFADLALSPGVVYPLAITRLWDTGTTATGGVVLW
jgi:hypothetical protein